MLINYIFQSTDYYRLSNAAAGFESAAMATKRNNIFYSDVTLPSIKLMLSVSVQFDCSKSVDILRWLNVFSQPYRLLLQTNTTSCLHYTVNGSTENARLLA